MPTDVLPDYERPPVVEIIAAAQFLPLSAFGMPEVVAVARAFSDWRIVDVPAALPPIVEVAPEQGPQQVVNFGFGSPPVRVILVSDDDRWLVQLQQDRVAVHERGLRARPSFVNVEPRVLETAANASTAVGASLLGDDHRPELVELVYENRIVAGEGWTDFKDLHRVLRALSAAAGEAPYDEIEQVAVSFSSVLTREGAFAGRLRVIAEPGLDEARVPLLNLRLISRRYVHNESLNAVLEECHTDIVEGFTAVTTPEMHEVWGRFR